MDNREIGHASQALSGLVDYQQGAVVSRTRACAITCKGYEAGLTELREGMSEKELAHIICSTMTEYNPEGIELHPWTIFVHSSGRSPV